MLSLEREEFRWTISEASAMFFKTKLAVRTIQIYKPIEMWLLNISLFQSVIWRIKPIYIDSFDS